MRVDRFDYELPEELIASHPPASRDGGRLLSLRGDEIEDRQIAELPDLLPAGSLLVVNDTRVLPARLFGRKRATSGRIELLLARKIEALEASDGHDVEVWAALGRSSKPMRVGDILDIDGADLFAEVRARGDDGALEVLLRAPMALGVTSAIESAGHVPLPPYMRRADEPEDRERYQTVFADVPGAVAAPTAGLHLTTDLLHRLQGRGVGLAKVTLHVGLGTFKPVTVDDLDDHAMHEEWLQVPQSTADAIASTRARGGKIVAVGTTVIRALESSLDEDGRVLARSGTTSLLIQPGYRFRAVDSLLTNFHLPKSTLLSLVSAFGGRSRVLGAYAHAVRERYRFFSYGDAMLLHELAPPEDAPA